MDDELTTAAGAASGHPDGGEALSQSGAPSMAAHPAGAEPAVFDTALARGQVAIAVARAQVSINMTSNTMASIAHTSIAKASPRSAETTELPVSTAAPAAAPFTLGFDTGPVQDAVAPMRAVIAVAHPIAGVMIGRAAEPPPASPAPAVIVARLAQALQPAPLAAVDQIAATRAAMAAMRAAAGRIIADVPVPQVPDKPSAPAVIATPPDAPTPAVSPLAAPVPVHVAAMAAARKLAEQAERQAPSRTSPLFAEAVSRTSDVVAAPPHARSARPVEEIPAPPPVLSPLPQPAPSPAAEPGRLPPNAVRIGVAKSYRQDVVLPAPVALAPSAPPMAAPAAIVAAALSSIPEPLTVPLPILPQTLPQSENAASGILRHPGAAIWKIALVGVRLAILSVLALGVFWTLALLAYRHVDPPTSTLMLGQYLTGRTLAQRWVPLERMSPNLIRAVIASEDGNFCRHRGVDWSAIDEALDKAAEDGGRPRGASTISMQTVKNLLLWPQAHYIRKVLELPLAYLAELAWGKRRILELYLNIAEWGPGIFGAEAAAQYHFRKSAAALSVQEAALLAVSLPNPIERNAGRPGEGTQRLGRRIERRGARPTLPLGCLGPLRQHPFVRQ